MDINWQGLISGAITVFVIGYFIKRAMYASIEGELRFGRFMIGLGLACLLFSVVPLVVLITENYQVNKPGETKALIGLIIGFGIGAIYCLIEAFFVKGSFDESGISFFTPWTGMKEEKWDDLVSIDFNDWCYWYVLKFKSGKVIRLSTYLLGHAYVLDLLEAE
jgi:hypothetical protein